MSSAEIWKRGEFVELLQDLMRRSARAAPSPYSRPAQFRLRTFCGEKAIWEYSGSTGQVTLGNDNDANQNALDAVDICGASKLTASFSSDGAEKKLDANNWKEWFLEKALGKFLIPDTNFIYRHYASKILCPILKEDFNRLIFRLPRLVVLEIERRGNMAKKQPKEKRLSFFAAREINFLRQRMGSGFSFEMLSNIDASLMTGFTETAGKQLTDMWIRKEIHDAMEAGMLGSQQGIVFLTCDLMNALAAEAEGLPSCYFSRLTQDKVFIDQSDHAKIFDLILATAMIFEKVRLDVMLTVDKNYESFFLRGMWTGKTTSQWYSDCIEVSNAA
jgi:hypothetical protein